MKWPLVCAFGFLSFVFCFISGQREKIIMAQAAEIRELYLRNASNSKDHWRFRGFNEPAIRETLWLYPMPEKALRSVRKLENGLLTELGVHGKTMPLCMYPKEYWQYLESARIISDMACQYAFSNRHRKEFVEKYLAPRYNPTPWKWSVSFEKQWNKLEKAELKKGKK